jgi:hypothetical protein
MQLGWLFSATSGSLHGDGCEGKFGDQERLATFHAILLWIVD